jgi:TPR repeat protein
MYWYRKAARRGDSSAAFNLGTVFRDKGKQRQALRWFRRSLDLGEGDALLEIAKLKAVVRGGRPRAVEILNQLLQRNDCTEATGEEAQVLLDSLAGASTS